MEVKCKFLPEYKLAEIKYKSDVILYACKLLQLVGAETLIVGLDNSDKPFVYCIDGLMSDALDVNLSED